MRAVFADAFYFIALLSPKDRAHTRATDWMAANLRPIVTTEFVLMEVADGMAKHGRRDVFVQWHSRFSRRSAIRLVPASQRLFERGIRMYKDHMDKEWTLTDCTSFVVMHHMGLKDALTDDKHFEQAGMNPLLR